MCIKNVQNLPKRSFYLWTHCISQIENETISGRNVNHTQEASIYNDPTINILIRNKILNLTVDIYMKMKISYFQGENGLLTATLQQQLVVVIFTQLNKRYKPSNEVSLLFTHLVKLPNIGGLIIK